MLCIVSALGLRAQLTNGTVYWIQDVSTGQFLSQGDSWATKAVAQDVGGLGWEAVYVSDGVYKLNNIMWNTVTSATVGLGVDAYVDQAPAEWTIEAKDGGYTIKNGDNYLVNNGTENAQKEKPIGKTTDAAAATVWKFLTKTEYDAAVQAYQDSKAAAYAAALGYEANSVAALEALIADDENQFITKDYTSSITNSTLGSNDTGWSHGRLGSRGNDAGGWNVGDGCAEFWNGCGSCTQTVSNLPNGLYKVTFVGSYRPANKAEALNLVSEKTSSPAFVYANDAKVEFLHWIDVPAQANGRGGITVANGYQNSFYTYVTDGTLALGVVADGWTNGYSWCTFGQFTLTQIYSVASYKKAYNDAMTAATAAQTSLTGFDVYASAKSKLDAAITENTLTGEDLADVDKLQAAAEALSAAAAAVAAEKAACDQYASIVSTIGEGTNVNLTNFVANASFETGNLSSWTSTDGGGVADNNNFSYKVGNYYVERWSWAGQSQVTLSNGTLVHDDIILPAGVYLLSANGQVQEQYNGTTGGGYYLYGNDEKVEMGVPGTYSTYVKLTDDKEKLVIKIALESCTGNWISCDDVQLTYVGADFPAYTLVTGKMKATTASAQSEAENTFTGAQTAANYNALLAAINAAQASKDAYSKTAPAIEEAKTLGINFNFATTAATTTFNEAVTAVETAYNNGTLSNESAANAGNLGTVLVGWHGARASENYTIAEAYMQSAWTNGELNDWSTEGDSDGSNFHVPFFQNWTGDGESLSVGTTSGQLTDLPNGLYKVSALVRVRIKNGQEAGTAPTGITLKVNDGDAVNACTGAQVGETQFYLGTIEAEGLVKDGVLNAVLTRADGNNVSWLSFKDIKYTKERDLTSEEMAVAPTAIALYNGENEVTEPIALDATTQTVTLTPSYTPANATEGYISWASSDETVATVADGVVTAVSTGTTTITATSTLDNTVSASATVTVTFPETATPAAYYVNNNATRTNYTPGENIIKNGAFEYPNAYYGWTVGTGAAMSADGFDIKTEEGNTYIKSKKGEGGGAVTSIKIGWPIESGKTYTFSYKIKGNAGKSSWTGTSLTNEIGTETFMIEREFNVTTDWQTKTYTFTNTDGYAYLQFWARWYDAAYDDFYLAEVTSTIEGNVQYALDAIPTANIGTGAFQYSQSAIDAANALVQGTATVADVEAAYEAVTTLNAPEAEKRYALTILDNGKAWDGNAVTFIAGARSDQGGYGIKYLAPANKNLAQALKLTHVSGNKYKVSIKTAAGTEQYMTTAKLGYNTGANEQIRTTDDITKALEVEIRATANDGEFQLFNTAANKVIANNDNNDVYTSRTANFTIAEAEAASIVINTTVAGWGTTMLPFAVASLPTDVKAYTCAEVNDTKLTLVEVTALEANKPYIIEGAWDETLTGDAQGTALTYTEGLLTGVYAAQAIPVGSYGMQNQDVEGVGFYRVEDGLTKQITANHAYLTVPNAGGVKAFYFGDTETAIKSVFDGVAAGDIYDLNGRKVARMQKGGIYVVNGHKVMVK